MTARIVVLGATGYTGELVTEALVRIGARPLLAGRRPDQLAYLAQQHGGLPIQQADAADPDSVRALINAGDVLITTVGPFERYGYGVAEAAAAVGAHYIDSTGEIGFVRELQTLHHDAARSHNATMLPAFGYDFVPGILAGALTTQAAGAPAHALRIGYFATGSVLTKGLSQGTRTTMADGLLLPITAYRDKQLIELRAACSVHAFGIRGRKRNSFLASGTEVLFLPQTYPQLSTVEVYNGWFPTLAHAVKTTSRISSAIARRPAVRRLVERINAATVGPAGGPDAAERAKTRTHVVAEITNASGEIVAETHLEGPSIYDLTGALIAAAAEQLSIGRSRATGVVGPLEAFGTDGLHALCASVGLTTVPR